MMKLDLGAGDVSPPGFTARGRPHSSEIYPLTDIADNSVEEVRASHCLEHFPHRQVPYVLREWVRVLKPGGLLRIAVPDFAKIAENYLKGIAQPTESYVMGAQIDADDFHKALFDKNSLTRVMALAGLVAIEPWKSELRDWASAPISLNLCGRKPLAGESKEAVSKLKEAIALHQQGRLNEAAALYGEVLAHNASDANALHLSGVLQAQREDLPAAIALIDRAIAIDPTNMTIFFNRAEILRKLGRLDEALISYEHVLAIKPDSAEALHKQGNLLQELNRFNDAVAKYDRALAIKPDDMAIVEDRITALRKLKSVE